MIDLLGNKKTSNTLEDVVSNKDPDIDMEKPKVEKRKKVNINRFKDSEGLTVRKMAFGLWFIKKRPVFIKSFYGVLIVIGFVTWSLFFFTFGKYFLFDMKKDHQNLVSFVNTGSVDHQITLSQLPKNLIVEPVKVLSNQADVYDFAVQVTNPNMKHFLLLSFLIEYDNGETRVVDEVVLSHETKYLLITGHKSEIRPRNLNFVIKTKNWERVSGRIMNFYDKYKNDRLNLVFSDKKFTQGKSSGLSEKISLNDLEFVVENKTAFNYWQVPLNIMLFGNSKLLAVRKYTIEKFLSEEIETINIIVTGTIPSVRKIEIESSINIFDEKAFMDFEGTVEEMNYE